MVLGRARSGQLSHHKAMAKYNQLDRAYKLLDFSYETTVSVKYDVLRRWALVVRL
jgi:hypothetical protein